MKALIVSLIALSTSSCFANKLPQISENYGEELTVDSYNFNPDEDKAFLVSDNQPGGDYSIHVMCAIHLQNALENAPVVNDMSAILIKKHIGSTSGTCLIKAHLNY